MNQISPQERRALRKRYAPEKKITKWTVVQNGIVLFENVSPSLVQWWLDNSGLKNAKKYLYMLGKKNIKKIAGWLNDYSLAFYYDDHYMAMVSELEISLLEIKYSFMYDIINLTNHES